MLRDEFADGRHQVARNEHEGVAGCVESRLVLSERSVLGQLVVVSEDLLDPLSIPTRRKLVCHCAGAYATGLVIGSRAALARRGRWTPSRRRRPLHVWAPPAAAARRKRPKRPGQSESRVSPAG